MTSRRATVLLLVAALAVVPVAVGEEVEARVSIDVKEAPVEAIVSLLVELGGRQVVFDSGLDCALTLKLREVPWLTALETTLRACGLGYEETAGILWVATTSRLREEAESRRRLKEARAPEPGRGLSLFRLSYARAEEMAPLLRRFVSPGGDVTVDPRTNTLIVRY
jgi:type II secretory pathway component HofQ